MSSAPKQILDLIERFEKNLEFRRLMVGKSYIITL
jgi:hypothetical protein